MDQLIREEIIRMEEAPMSDKEKRTLQSVKGNKFIHMLVVYLGLSGVIGATVLRGLTLRDGIYDRRGNLIVEFKEGRSLLHNAFPWLLVCGILFLILSIYFWNFYKKTIIPLGKDIKKGTKLILFLHLQKREPFLNRFFIFVPLQKNRQLEVSAEDYYKLTDGLVKLAIAPHSYKIVGLLNDNESVSFREHNS